MTDKLPPKELKAIPSPSPGEKKGRASSNPPPKNPTPAKPPQSTKK